MPEDRSPPARKPKDELTPREEGGHGRPEMAGELFQSSLSAAAEFSVECGHTLLFDSSKAITLVAHIERFELTALAEPLPQWVQDYFPPPAHRTAL